MRVTDNRLIGRGAMGMSEVAGLLSRSLDLPFVDVLARAERAILAIGAELMAKIDHGEAAQRAGLPLRPTMLLLFGNPAAGTHLMAARPDSAIDLPLKLLVVADEDSGTRIVGEDPRWIATRHDAAPELDPLVKAMQQAMQRVLDLIAAQPPT